MRSSVCAVCLFVAVTVMGCDLDANTGQADQAVIGPDACTAVALVSPASSFTLPLGTPLPLSASATCPTGQTPEFSYWHKLVGAANWTMDPYVPGGSTFTAPAPGDWCVQVAARAVGAVDANGNPVPYQVRTGSTCGSIGAPETTTRITTVLLPISRPGERIPTSVLVSRTRDSGVYEAPIAIPIGTRIVGLRVMGFDNLDGPSTFIVGLRMSDITGNSFIAGAGLPSNGTGAIQTVTSSALNEAVVSGMNYGCDVVLASGTGSVALHSCEVDIIQPQ